MGLSPLTPRWPDAALCHVLWAKRAKDGRKIEDDGPPVILAKLSHRSTALLRHLCHSGDRLMAARSGDG